MRVLTSIDKRIGRIAAIVALLALIVGNTRGAAAANLNGGAQASMLAGSACSVGPNGASYTKIQDAANDASCATINVAPGTYQENVKIGRAITINGAGASSTIVDGGKGLCATINSCTVFTISQPVAVTFSGLTIRNGYNTGGGGIQVGSSANVTIQNSVLANNTAYFPYNGGAIEFKSNSGSLTVSNSTFSGNSAGGSGAAIANNGAALTVLNSGFSGNGGKSQLGGAIYTFGLTTIKNSSFFSNRGIGGALYLDGGTTTIVNSTFANNQGDGYEGGAIFLPNGGILNISSSTLVGNNAAWGGGISFHGGTVSLKSTILANNTATISPGNCYRVNGDLRNGGNNLRWPSSDSSCVGTFGDPKLEAIANNGGPTQSMALLPGSAAIDKGACTDVGGAALGTDQRGLPRPSGAACDIGAFEKIAGNIAYWKLDEGTGATATDSSGSGKHGTITFSANPWSATHAPTVFSNPYALNTSGGISRVSAPLVTTQTDNVTLSAWVVWNGGTGSGQTIVYNGNTASSGYGIFITTNNHVQLLAGGVAFYDFGYTLPTQSTAWTHVALVRAGGTWKLYVGGVQQGGTSTVRPNTPTSGTYIASNNGGQERFNGLIDDVRIYNRALSAAEIQWLAAGNL